MKLEFKKSVPAEKANVPLLLKYFALNIGPILKSENAEADCLLALDEAVTNIVMYAYSEVEDDIPKLIELSIVIDNEQIIMNLSDYGNQFRPEDVPSPDISENLKGKRKGGFGIFLMKKLMDNFQYYYKNGKNYLSLVKYLH